MFTKKEKDIDGQYLNLFIHSIDSLFRREDNEEFLQKVMRELDFDFIAIGKLDHRELCITMSSYPPLVDAVGTNVLILEHIENSEALYTDKLEELLSGFISVDAIEDLQYSRKIHNTILVTSENYACIASRSAPIDASFENILRTLLELIITYKESIVGNKNKVLRLQHENKVLKELEAFINYAIFKGNFEAVAEYAVDQIADNLDYPAVLIIVREHDIWKPVALTKSALIEKVKQILGKSFTDFYAQTQDENKTLQAVLEHENTITHDLVEVLCPPLSKITAQTIQKVLGIHLIYSVPLEYHNKLLGIISFMTKHDSIDEFEEEVMKDYAKELGLILANVETFQTLQNSKTALEQAYKQLEETNKEKDNLMSMASHELQTPATIARDAIDLLFEMHKLEDPEVIDKIHMIQEAAGRQLQIINTMLEVSRINTKKMELIYKELDLENLIDIAIEEMQLEAKKKGLQITYQKENSPLPPIKADYTRIREVFDNLLMNGIKYTENGSITITSRLKDMVIEVQISDTGKGIAKDMQSSLFQMFHRINGDSKIVTEQDSHQGGLGLGLYIVKNIIDAHNGTITVDSKENEGTTFTLHLPIS